MTERRHLPRCNAGLTVNESIARLLRARYPGKEVAVLHNFPAWAPPSRTNKLRTLLRIPETEIILLSQGGLQAGRGSGVLVDALKDLENHCLVFLGSGAMREEILRHASERGVMNRVHIVDDVRSDELGSYTASADLGLCVIENHGESYYLSLPNKLFEYIAAGLPVVASAFPEISAVVSAEQIGLTIDPGDPTAIAGAIRRLAPTGELYGSCAERCLAARKRYHWSVEEDRLVSLVGGVLGQRFDLTRKDSSSGRKSADSAGSV
jgi:glycosyltransferase involved in cell wall biosynthesis